MNIYIYIDQKIAKMVFSASRILKFQATSGLLYFTFSFLILFVQEKTSSSHAGKGFELKLCEKDADC